MLYRKADGEVAASWTAARTASRRCSMGKIVGGNRIQCPYHGLEFDASGACVLQSARRQEHPLARAACTAIP